MITICKDCTEEHCSKEMDVRLSERYAETDGTKIQMKNLAAVQAKYKIVLKNFF